MSPIRVILVDDHPIIRDGIRNLIEQNIDIKVVGEAATGEEALHLIEELSPDVLLLDFELPDINGLEVVKHLRQNGSTVKVLVLSAHDDEQSIRELMECGVSGYLMKEEAPETVVDAIRGAAFGDHDLGDRCTSAHIISILQGEEGTELKFTPRERQVLRLVAEGNTNQGIAASLGISEKTVEKYMGAIFQKLEVTSRVEAAVYAVREGIV